MLRSEHTNCLPESLPVRYDNVIKGTMADDKNLDDEAPEREELLWIKWEIKLPEDEKTLA